MIKISQAVNEKGTISFEVSFFDEENRAVAPTEILYSLVDSRGTIVNSIQQKPISSPESTVTITLSGDDLQLLTHEAYSSKVYRFLVIEATYTSDIGEGLKMKESIRFKVENLIFVT